MSACEGPIKKSWFVAKVNGVTNYVNDAMTVDNNAILCHILCFQCHIKRALMVSSTLLMAYLFHISIIFLLINHCANRVSVRIRKAMLCELHTLTRQSPSVSPFICRCLLCMSLRKVVIWEVNKLRCG